MDFPSFRNIPSWRFVSIPGQSVSILNDSVIKHPDVAAALELLKPYQATLVEADCERKPSLSGIDCLMKFRPLASHGTP